MGGMEEGSSLRGKLLVAGPGLVDPNFARTVVLVCEHTDEGALGVVLNRASDTPLPDELGGWRDLLARPPVVFAGGPVVPEGVLCLAKIQGAPPEEGWHPVLGPLGTLDLRGQPELVGAAVERIRVFAGHAGWAPGQLEAEVDAGGWFVCEADPEDALTPEPDALWSFVLRRQGGRLAMVSTYPEDPSLN